MTLKTKSYILNIEPYKPGLSSSSKVGVEESAIKLSSNENALGASLIAVDAYKKHSSKISRYASGGCETLKKAIAKKYDIDPARVVCGAGSDEIIALLCQGFANIDDEILYSEYGFLMYPISAKRIGAKPVIAKKPILH